MRDDKDEEGDVDQDMASRSFSSSSPSLSLSLSFFLQTSFVSNSLTLSPLPLPLPQVNSCNNAVWALGEIAMRSAEGDLLAMAGEVEPRLVYLITEGAFQGDVYEQRWVHAFRISFSSLFSTPPPFSSFPPSLASLPSRLAPSSKQSINQSIVTDCATGKQGPERGNNFGTHRSAPPSANRYRESLKS